MIQIIGWEKFQNYKYRGAAWVKLYVDLLDDVEFRILSSQARSTLIDLWLLGASTKDGVLRQTLEVLSWRLREPVEALQRSLAEIQAVLDEKNEPKWLILKDVTLDCTMTVQSLYNDSTILEHQRREEKSRVEKSLLRTDSVQLTTRPRGKRADPGPEGPPNWVAQLEPVFARIGEYPFGLIGKVCKPVIERHGVETTVRALGAYVKFTLDQPREKIHFSGPVDFAKRAGYWVEFVRPGSGVPEDCKVDSLL